MSIYCSADETPSGNSSEKAYTFTKDWNQSQVTWSNATSSQKWTTPGGDKSLTSVAEKSFTENEAGKWSDFTVTDAIKGFVKTPASNFGFLFINPGPAEDKLTFESSESSQLDKRPKLTVTYSPTTIKNTNDKGLERVTVQSYKNMIMVTFPKAENRSFTLVKTDGRTAAMLNSYSSTVSLSTKGIAAGAYFLKIKTGTSVLTLRTVIY